MLKPNKNRKVKVVFTLLLVFIISVFIRQPNLNRPLSTHQEIKTAISLRVLQIWQNDGALKYNFNPVLNYSDKVNKNINNHSNSSGSMKDLNGNYYYVKHPQFAYMFPYLVFKLFHIKATVLSLQLFNLVINFFSASFVYLIISLLSIQKPFKKVFIPGLVGFAIYLFSPNVLWFQSNIYMSDTLVQLPFILAVYTMLKLLMRRRFFSVKYLLYYALFLFLMIYTSWLGLFFAFSVFIYSIIKLRYEKVFIPLIFITIGVSFFTMYLVFKQYSLINGSEAYIVQLYKTFSNNELHLFSGVMLSKLPFLKAILFSYSTSFLPIYILLLVFVMSSFKTKKLGFVFTKNGVRFLWLATLPVLFLHFVFMNLTKAYPVSLYGSLFLSVVVGIIYDKLKRKKIFSHLLLNGGIALTLFLSVALYYYINKPGDYSWNDIYYATNKEIGLFIKKDAQKDEKIFISGKVDLNPQLIVYAERNIQRIKKTEIDRIIKAKKGVCYYVEKSGAIQIYR